MADSAPQDLGALDRLVSRSVAVIGLLGLLGVWFAKGQHLPQKAIVAFACVYCVGKVGVAVAGLIRGWAAWPAALAEGLAIALVAAIVWTGTRDAIYLLLIAGLLLGAAFWRGRVARMTSRGHMSSSASQRARPAAPKTAPRWPLPVSLAIVLVTVALAGGLFWLCVQQQVPGWGWIFLIVAGVVVWYEQRLLPGLKERSDLRIARAEALRLVKAVRIAAKKQKTWTGSGTKEQLDKLCDDLASSVAQNAPLPEILQSTQKLDELAEKALTRKSAGREYFEQIGGALLAAGILRAFFYEAFKIPSGSMVPTLLVGDHLFVNKFAYGFRVPFSLKKYFIKVPGRGDIVVFDRPPKGDGDALIKRVIGLPGDTIEVRNRHVTVNGVAFETSRQTPFDLNDCDVAQDDAERHTSCDPNKQDRFLPFEEHVGKHTHTAVAIAAEGIGERGGTEGTWQVKPDHVFVMGDNRDNSLDSRFDISDGGFGQVPLNFIKGRADVIWLSLGGKYGIRFERMFSLVH